MQSILNSFIRLFLFKLYFQIKQAFFLLNVCSFLSKNKSVADENSYEMRLKVNWALV